MKTATSEVKFSLPFTLVKSETKDGKRQEIGRIEAKLPAPDDFGLQWDGVIEMKEEKDGEKINVYPECKLTNPVQAFIWDCVIASVKAKLSAKLEILEGKANWRDEPPFDLETLLAAQEKGEALANRREAVNSFVAFLTAANKKAQVITIFKGMLEKADAIQANSKNKAVMDGFDSNLAKWAVELKPDQFAKFASTIKKATDAIEASKKIEVASDADFA